MVWQQKEDGGNMFKLIRLILTTTAAASLAGAAYQANAQIGMIASAGDFTIAGVKSAGTATVFSGDSVSTESTATQIHLSSGINWTLAPHSTVAVYSDHLQLARGTVSGQSTAGFRVISEGMVLRPVKPGTEAEVQVAENRVTVAIPKGEAYVGTVQGAVVAHMMQGNVLSYQAIGGNNNHVQALGVLNSQDGHYLIRDRFTNVVSELQGKIPAAYLNKLVRVNGELATETSTVPQVDRLVSVTEIKRSDATSAVPCESDPGGSVAKEMVVDGILTQEEGHYLVNTSEHGYVEVIGDVDKSQIGKKIHMKGSLLQSKGAYAPAEQIVYTEKRKFVFADSPCAGLITGGVVVTAGLLAHAGSGTESFHQPLSY
jgi:hypothetical protein